MKSFDEELKEIYWRGLPVDDFVDAIKQAILERRPEYLWRSHNSAHIEALTEWSERMGL